MSQRWASPFSAYLPPADPQQLFPGLIYRMIKPKVVLLIFVSGKIVLTGAKVCLFLFFVFYTSQPLCAHVPRT